MERIASQPGRATYAVEVLEGLPADGEVPRAFARVPHRHVPEGLVVRVAPADGKPWIANFQRGGGRVSGVWPTPAPDKFLAVASGYAYWVDATKPERTCPLAINPVVEVRLLPAGDTLILVGLTRIVALARDGQKWEVDAVSWDGIRIVEADHQGITGIAWDAVEEREVGFFIDPRSGQLEGGSGSPAPKREAPH